MNTRTTLILAAVLVVLAGAAALVESGKKKSRSPVGEMIFPAFSAEKADAIQIHSADQDVRLQKKGDEWVVESEGGYPADPKLPKEILDKMELFRTTELISTQKEKHSVFEVDSTGFDIKILQGSTPLASFTVGKPGPDFMSCYVRPEGSDAVYRVPVPLRSTVDRGEQTWRNQLVLAVPQDSVASYTTRNPRETVTVTKKEDGTWQITEPIEAPAKQEVVSMVLRSLTQVKATGFADTVSSLAAVGLDPDTMRVDLRLEDGSSYTIIIGASNPANQTYTKRSDSPIVYLIPKGRWNTVFRPVESLRAPEASPTPSSEEGSAPGAGS